MTNTFIRGSRRSLVLVVLAVVALLATACGSNTGAGNEQAAAEENSSAPSGETAASASLIIQSDIVQGTTNLTDEMKATQACVQNNRFPHNSEIVWRMRVFDPATGDEMDDAALQSVTVELADGQSFDAKYGGHPHDNPLDFFWTTSFDIPADYPTGTLDYTITATGADGRTGTFKPFNVAPSLLTVTDEALTPVAGDEG